ncbi:MULTISPECIES: cell division topological specificity factor MinE [Carboxydothermus]|uniref:Cell division topological specificity factor n=2 Tax=Carboxydothermus TaxID=129957 RepID=MINE_CARHZ|nr:MULTISPECIES: cell division topological specificity factor MinE [Carboxydothermus]Q3AF72.1 RecName: Full=Cell division topological specificity factor [Carboxydothermus hydrogenoformans Z-2901]ABB13695.1 cell division topological specificity factor MinE [Carboxydothermus hydrogenoformans Z-2901]
MKLFGKEQQNSKTMAKERLRLVLVQDRTNVSPELLQNLKEDLIAVITKYMEIDEKALEVNIDSHEDQVALIANIPIKNVKRSVRVQTN